MDSASSLFLRYLDNFTCYGRTYTWLSGFFITFFKSYDTSLLTGQSRSFNKRVPFEFQSKVQYFVCFVELLLWAQFQTEPIVT